MSEYDIPVLFQVSAVDEDAAASAVAFAIGHLIGNARDDTLPYVTGGRAPDDHEQIESWFLPNHKFADGNDIPVRVAVVPLEPAYNERMALVQSIEDMLR